MFPWVITEEEFKDGLQALKNTHSDMISDPEIQDPEEGEKVCYIPDHAHSTAHEDSEYGEVTNVGEAGIMVDFDHEPKRGSKLCYRKNLIRLGETRA